MDPLAIVGLLIAMFIWGSSFVALKLAFVHYDPMVVIFGRMAIGALCFLPLLIRCRPVLQSRRDLRLFLLMALCEPCLYFLFEAKALENTTASQAGLISSFLPLLVAVGAHAFLKERITPRMLTGFLVAVAGACWLSLSSDTSASAPNPPLGNLLEFAAMVCATGYTLLLKHLTRAYSPFFLTAVQALVGSVFYFPLLFLPSTQMPTALHPVSAMAVIYLGTAVTAGAYGLYNFGVSRIPASQATAFVNLIPVFAVLLGWLVLGEQFNTPQYAAALMILGGIGISQAANGRRRRPAPNLTPDHSV